MGTEKFKAILSNEEKSVWENISSQSKELLLVKFNDDETKRNWLNKKYEFIKKSEECEEWEKMYREEMTKKKRNAKTILGVRNTWQRLIASRDELGKLLDEELGITSLSETDFPIEFPSESIDKSLNKARGITRTGIVSEPSKGVMQEQLIKHETKFEDNKESIKKFK